MFMHTCTHTHLSIVTCGSFPRAGGREENLGQVLSGLLLFNLILTMQLPRKGASVGIIPGIQRTDPTPHALLSAPCTCTDHIVAGQPCHLHPSLPSISAFLYRDARFRKTWGTIQKSQAQARQLTWRPRVTKLVGWDLMVWKHLGPQALLPTPILYLPPLAKPQGGGRLSLSVCF